MQIPSCIKLEQRQIDKLKKFENILDKYEPITEYEEVSMASAFTFSIFSTGIGDSIMVESRGYWCCLAIGDDNELIDSDEDKYWLELGV